MAALTRLSASRDDFPDPRDALEEPNGLVAIGGDLAPSRLLAAYRAGIFPWFDDDDEPILWWSPDPRAVLRPRALRVHRSLRKRMRSARFHVTADTAFDAVVAACAQPRSSASGRGSGTWITPRMRAAYIALHTLGYAHSIECWRGDLLIGGLYGVSLGRIFFGESMFSRESDASKVALVHLARQAEAWKFPLIDCQVMNPHLSSLGAEEMQRTTFLEILRDNVDAPTRRGRWVLDPPTVVPQSGSEASQGMRG
jgi:leucyl/phenylalanyl-tRNA--protein transferase